MVNLATRRHIVSFLAMSVFVLGASAQQETPDRLPANASPRDSLPSYLQPVGTPAMQDQPDSLKADRTGLNPDHIASIESTLALPSIFAPSRRTFRPSVIVTPGTAAFRLWDGSVIAASGSRSSMPGLMGIEQGRLSFVQEFGNLTLTAYASATHYGYFRGLQTAYGFGGSLRYRFNDKWSMTLFGSYSTGASPLTPAMAGYMKAPCFGGYASYEINEHWGINVGAKATRSLVTNRWEAQPIVAPYYKINGNAAIGVDVGGILYNVIQNAVERQNNSRPNPTIGPPVGGPPPVAPRPDKY